MQYLPKHVSVLTDFGFKKMFGEENKQFLISLINSVLSPQEAVITDITYRNTEQLGDAPNDKKMIFDNYCLTADGRHVIVELQVGSQSYYGERAVTYVSRIISKEAKRGVRSYELPTVYSINLLNFKMPVFNTPEEFFYEVQLKNQYNEIFLPKYKLYFIELCTFARLFKNREFSSDLQRWLYIISNMGTEKLQECPFDTPLFQDFFEQGRTSKLTPMEKEDYKKSIYDYQDVQDTIEYARERARAEGEARGEARGRAEGIAEGRAEGIAEGKLAMAKALIAQGISLDIIINTTGLSAEQICG